MKLFFRDNKGYIFLYYISIAITLIYSSLKEFIGFNECIYMLIVNTFILIVFLVFRYYKNKKVYKIFVEDFNSLDECLIDLGNSVLGKNISEILKKQHLLYEKKVQEYNKIYKDHLTFVNQWVHQMKTPLSIIQLQVHENEGEETIENIRDEVEKLNKGLNMAMNFARINSFEHDFVVEQIDLNQLVMDKVNEEKKLFIKYKIMPKVEIDKSMNVYSDGKWIKFVLEQLIVNGLKYSKDKGKYLTISAVKMNNSIKLSVIDEGVGIPNKDIKRVFDLFFTGQNGRKFGESTGMGLYIVKKVCDYLNHDVNIESMVNEGTVVTITFNDNLEGKSAIFYKWR